MKVLLMRGSSPGEQQTYRLPYLEIRNKKLKNHKSFLHKKSARINDFPNIGFL